MQHPLGVAEAADGAVLVADTANHLLRGVRLGQDRLLRARTATEVVTVAGSGGAVMHHHFTFRAATNGVVEDRLIRGLSPFPGAFFEADFGKGPERVKVLSAEAVPGSGAPGTLLDTDGTVACGEGAVHLCALRRAGKGGVSSGAEFVRGTHRTPGTRLA